MSNTVSKKSQGKTVIPELTRDGAGSGWFVQRQLEYEDGSGAAPCNAAGCGASGS